MHSPLNHSMLNSWIHLWIMKMYTTSHLVNTFGKRHLYFSTIKSTLIKDVPQVGPLIAIGPGEFAKLL